MVRSLLGKGSYMTHVLKDGSEVVRYGTAGIPLSIITESLSDYLNMHSIAHWHEDLEIIYVISGQLFYHVNGDSFLLKTNECVLVNAGQIHYGTSDHYIDCTFTCVLFHPKLFSGSRKFYDKCLKPILEDPMFNYIRIPSGHDMHAEIASLVLESIALQAESMISLELLVMSRLSKLLWDLSQKDDALVYGTGYGSHATELEAQRKMLSFIRQEYMEHITLADIAASGNVCRSKCCELFKKYIMQSPIEYLRYYRLEVSRSLLENSSTSVTDITGLCGFEQASYFIRLFKDKYGITPAAFRKGKRRL